MINGVNSALQSQLQAVQPERQPDAPQAAAPEAVPAAQQDVKVSLRQTEAARAGERAQQVDYRELGRQAVVAAQSADEAEATQDRDNLRNQAFLATAALKG